MILETGVTKWLGLGVVFEDCDTDLFPGWEKGTVGYHTSDRRIYKAGYTAAYSSKNTTGRTSVKDITDRTSGAVYFPCECQVYLSMLTITGRLQKINDQ